MSTQPRQSSVGITKQLHAGINAAREGKPDVARAYLNGVLAKEPENIPALLWLAFIAETAQESVDLLKKVLTLDPNNERAKSGLRWAESRLDSSPKDIPSESETDDESTEQSDDDDEPFEPLALRQQLFSRDSQNKGRKSVLAHRARRTINPFLMFLIGITITSAFLSISTNQSNFVLANNTATETSPASTHVNDDEPLDIFQLVTETRSDRPSEIPSQKPASDFSRFSPTIQNRSQAIPAAWRTYQTNHNNQTETVSLPTNPNNEPTLFEPVEPSLLAHQPEWPEQKWIEVDLAAQQVTAWEGNVPIMSFPTSTGKAETPTISGKFNIYWKLKKAVMMGDDYYLPDVPYTMYFYNDYGIHGTYWHNNFGIPVSHGCVNLQTENAKELFEWTGPHVPDYANETTSSAHNLGTLVVVHE
ncbi:L,D-transpeptidase family protein [Anaerolineales bacterium HSG6]|nr:L,D-transpeptidase family protein [Anaerolineales bacterium HSG6]